MTELILMMTLSAVSFGATPAASVRPCGWWPNLCAKEAPAVAQFQPCVLPNQCAKAAPLVARYQTCVWPNPCKNSPAG